MNTRYEKLGDSEPFLDQDELSSNSDSVDGFVRRQRQDESSPWKVRSILAALAVSVLGNIAFTFDKFGPVRHPVGISPVSEFAGLEFDRDVKWTHYTPYANINLTESAPLWDDIDFDSGFIALDYEYAERHGLPKSQPFPWDQSKGIYLINAYHSLHCLKSIHQFIRETEANTTRSFPLEHIMHCLDSLRMEAICTADDVPRWTSPEFEHFLESGVGQPRQCRDFSKLEAWAKEHHSCYGRIDELHQCENQMERYKFCPEDSPYQEIMHDYFKVVMGRELPWVVPKEKGKAGMCDMSKQILGGGFSGTPEEGSDASGYGAE